MNDIDLVIPMVFPQDAVWQRNYAMYYGSAKAAVTSERYRSWGTEELLVKCCMEYMPWVHRIFLVLASESQVQDWMRQPFLRPDGSKRPEVELTIVFHSEFMPAKLLPCFNVLNMEMFLHRIPGLSEHFIYSNDDFFPLSPLGPDDFFRPDSDGKLLPCQHFEERPWPEEPNTFHLMVKNGLDMVAGDWGRTFTTTWLHGGHSMQPMLLSTVRKVRRLHDDRIGDSFTVERKATNFNQYIYPFWQHLSGRYIDHVPRRQYAGPRTPTNQLADIIRDPDCGIVCLNDNGMISDWQERAAVARREIEAKLASPHLRP